MMYAKLHHLQESYAHDYTIFEMTFMPRIHLLQQTDIFGISNNVVVAIQHA
jgi:hypothetical protein